MAVEAIKRSGHGPVGVRGIQIYALSRVFLDHLFALLRQARCLGLLTSPRLAPSNRTLSLDLMLVFITGARSTDYGAACPF